MGEFEVGILFNQATSFTTSSHGGSSNPNKAVTLSGYKCRYLQDDRETDKNIELAKSEEVLLLLTSFN
jgi:hypothetical protein